MGLGSTTRGSAVLSGQNGLRLEWRVDRSLSSASASLRLRIWVATRRSAYDSSNSFSVSGSWPSRSTSVSISHSSSSSWSSSNRTLVYDETISVSRQYGSSVSRSLSASLSGVSIVGGRTASVSGSVSVPARSYNRPAAPSSLTASRQSDSRTNLSWSLNGSSSAPYRSQQLQRRYLREDGQWSGWAVRASLGANTSSYSDSTTGNWRYQWRVRAQNEAGWSSHTTSNQLDTTPAAPANVRARSTASGIRLEWENRARFPAWTQLQHQAGSGSWEVWQRRGQGAEDALWSDPDLTVTHRFRVRHEGQGSPSLLSDWAYSNRVELAAPPAAPTGLGPATVWDAAEDRVLSWRHVPTDGSGQERFQVRHRLQGGEWTTVPAVASEQSRWTLPGGTYSPGDVIEWQVRTMGVHPDWGPWS